MQVRFEKLNLCTYISSKIKVFLSLQNNRKPAQHRLDTAAVAELIAVAPAAAARRRGRNDGALQNSKPQVQANLALVANAAPEVQGAADSGGNGEAALGAESAALAAKGARI